MSYLVESPEGERCFVDDLTGYKNWTVLAKGAAARPKEHSSWDQESGKWKADPASREKELRGARARSMEREELVERLEKAEEALASLSARLDKAGL